MAERNCITCAYDKGKVCKILKEKIPIDCFAWADEEEVKRREKAIIKYSGNYSGIETSKRKLSKEEIERRTIARKQNLKNRGGKSNKEYLDEKFYWLYSQGLSDIEIAKKMNIDARYVNEYRRNKNLPSWQKNCSASQQNSKEK